MLVSTVLPTYNEAANIIPLIEGLLRSAKGKYETEIIVVDDDSADKTWEIVHDFAKNLENVIGLADNARIPDLCTLLDKNSDHLTKEFLKLRMLQAKAVDEVLGKMI